MYNYALKNRLILFHQSSKSIVEVKSKLRDVNVNRRRINLNTYLTINLAVLCMILLGLWRGEPVWNVPVSMPNLLLILVVINTALIFRDALLSIVPMNFRRDKIDQATLYSLRKVLANRSEPNASMISEVASEILKLFDQQGTQILQLSERGLFTVIVSTGIIPVQFQNARLIVINDILHIRHPSNLGDEPLTSFESFRTPICFRSTVTNFRASIIPLFVMGNQRYILMVFPAGRRLKLPQNWHTAAAFLEAVLAIENFRLQAGDGRYADSETGLLRYESFREALDTEVERSERYHQTMALLAIKVSPWENLSHEQTDALKKAVATAMRESLRRLDLMFCGKLPGDFAAILTETSNEVACLIANRIQSAFNKQVSQRTALKDYHFTMNIGTSNYPGDATHAEGLLEKTIDALNAAQSAKVPVVAYDVIDMSQSSPDNKNQGDT